MRLIEKKTISQLPKNTGSISDTLNVEDKVSNAPSINLVQKMVGIPTDGIIAYETKDGIIPEGYEDFADTLITMQELSKILRKKMIKRQIKNGGIFL